MRDTSTPLSGLLSGQLPGYAELHCLSNFSFLRGASHPESLVEYAAELGYAALALTDECSLAGVVRAHVEAKKLPGDRPLKLLIGSELRLSPRAGHPGCTLVALAQDKEGYGNLSELITLARGRAPKGEYRLHADDLDAPAAAHAHLRGLPGCIVLLSPERGTPLEDLLAQAEWTARTFGPRARMALTLLHHPHEDTYRAAVETAARRHGLPLAATGRVEMHTRSRKPLHDTLAAIRLGQPVHACGYALAPNAEQHLRTRQRLAASYPPEALAETLRIAQACTFSLDELRYEYPEEIVPAGHTAASYLREATREGAAQRYPHGVPPAVQTQIDHELALIIDLKYEAYFLTVHDLVQFARSKAILCQGRGSAANSTVCYCLHITEVNPAESTLLFERFISRERGEPPDIDVDFEHQRREEVIQYVYEKYGRARAALTAVVISYRPRSVLRDTGRALGIDEVILDAVARQHQWWDGKDHLMDRFARAGLDPSSPVAQHWAWLAEQLMGFPRHLSQHPGGFVMSRGPLTRLVPIENAAMADRSVVQWDKDDLDAVGLLKVDVLALGMLTVLRRAMAWVAQRRSLPGFAFPDIPDEDGRTYDMICDADTIGVFQIESRAQMSMLPRLRPRTYYDLVVEVAIVRPGPIQGGMVHPYLRRKNGGEKHTAPTPEIGEVLARTLGVPIFQEQVMQIAMVGAGFSADDADQLRRSMAAWRRKGGVDKFRNRLIDGLLKHGCTQEFADSLFRQIEGFGEYGFPESHAASFAKLAYYSSWIKRHEPEAFLAALLDSQPMGFYQPAQLVHDARRHGVQVLPVDVCHSEAPCTLVERTVPAPDPLPAHAPGDAPRPAVRLGLNQVAGLSQDTAERIAALRAESPFTDVHDLSRRAGLTRHELDALAAAGALATLAGHRRQARWVAAGAVADAGLLRAASVGDVQAPALSAPSEGEDIIDDYESVGLTLGRHPVHLLRPRLTGMRFMPAATLNGYPHGRLARACGIVTGRQRPPTAKGVLFVTIEDETGPVNVVLRPELVERQRREATTATLLGVYGVWQSHQGVRHLVAGRLVDCSPLLGRLTPHSRDFH
ncbi:DNA polymerase III alpha subunit [plant metagenome]|uniref:Error-prone DNA polymerase n=1 Tax=plant metagenome TaxID=1297885 RepID=A0A484NS05_9ZZZZ